MYFNFTTLTEKGIHLGAFFLLSSLGGEVGRGLWRVHHHVSFTCGGQQVYSSLIL